MAIKISIKKAEDLRSYLKYGYLGGYIGISSKIDQKHWIVSKVLRGEKIGAPSGGHIKVLEIREAICKEIGIEPGDIAEWREEK